MLYEIFLENTSHAFIITTNSFGSEQARLMFPTAKQIAVKPRPNFICDNSTVILLDNVTEASIGKVVGALIKKEVENAKTNFRGKISAANEND
jgi:hypothetical protein